MPTPKAQGEIQDAAIASIKNIHRRYYTTDCLFMQKGGGGYIFVHRMLLEHFAQMKLD
jgi:hypothetical protein